jgi:hypothetical protein
MGMLVKSACAYDVRFLALMVLQQRCVARKPSEMHDAENQKLDEHEMNYDK